MPNMSYGIPAYFVISRVEAASNLHRFDGVKYGYRTTSEYKELRDLYRKTRAEGFGLQPKLRILMGMYVSAAQYSEQYYARALKVRSLIRSDFEAAFNPDGAYKLDALLTQARQSGQKVLHGHPSHIRSGLVGGASHVGQEHHVREFRQSRRQGGFVFIDVQSRTQDLPGTQCLDQGGFLHHGTLDVLMRKAEGFMRPVGPGL